MKHLLVTLGLLLACSAVSAQGVSDWTATTGTATVTRTTGVAGDYVTVAWTSNAAGNVTVTGIHLEGMISRVTFANGSATPTNLYDVTMTDQDSIDVLGGDGANIAVATNVVKVPALDSYQSYVQGQHTVTITNAGNAKSGTLRIYLFRGE